MKLMTLFFFSPETLVPFFTIFDSLSQKKLTTPKPRQKDVSNSYYSSSSPKNEMDEVIKETKVII